ncbi:hypothetical protein D3C86_1703060 [compost metagenome]
MIAGVEFPEAVFIDIDDKGTFGGRQRNVRRFDGERRPQLEIAHAQHDGGEVHQLGKGGRTGHFLIGAPRQHQHFGEAEVIEPVGKAGFTRCRVECGAFDAEEFGHGQLASFDLHIGDLRLWWECGVA